MYRAIQFHEVTAIRHMRAACAGLPFILPDAYTIDGVSGKPSHYLDQSDLAAHAVLQTTSARQSALPTVSGSFGSRLSAPWNPGGSGFVYYDSNRAASQFRYLHGAQGGSLQLGVFKLGTGSNYRTLHCNRTSVGTGTAVYARSNDVTKPRAETFANSTSIANPFAGSSDELPAYCTYLITPAAYEFRYRGTLIGSGVPASAPVDSDGNIPLRIGAVTSAFGPFTGEWAGCAFFPPTTSLSLVQTLVQAIWGIAP